jgi:methyltransferase-like protein
MENIHIRDLEHCYRRNDNFVFRRIEDETILVPIKDNVGDLGSIYSLNEIGAFIWEHLDGQQNLDDIIDLLLNEFDVPAGQVEDDLFEFVADLVDIAAVELVD